MPSFFHSKKLDFLKNPKFVNICCHRGIYLCVALVWLPLVLEKVASPIQSFDYLASFPDEALYLGDWISWTSFFPNLWENFFSNANHFRPFSFGLMHILFLMFGSNYYLHFLVKIAANVTLIIFVFKIVKFYTKTLASAYVSGCFLLVHPAPMNLMLYSNEGLVAFFIIIALWLMLHNLEVWKTDAIGGELTVNFDRTHAVSGVLIAATTIAVIFGLKETGVLFGTILFTALVTWVLFANYKTLFKYILLAAAAGFASTCIYRVYLVRQHVMFREQSHFSIAELMEQIQIRIGDALVYTTPIQLNAPVGPYVAILIGVSLIVAVHQPLRLVINSTSLQEFVRRILCFPLILFGLLIVGIISVSVPSGYPPRVSPRYLIPAISCLAILVGVGMAPLLRRWPIAGVVASVYLLLAAPNITYKRELNWWAYNEMFSVLINRIEERALMGHRVYVNDTSELSRTLLRFFSADGRRLFGDSIPIVRTFPYETSMQPRDRFLLVDFRPPSELLNSSQYIVENIEVVDSRIPKSIGFAKLTLLLDRIGQLVGGSAVPYFESGTVDLQRRPPMYLYHLCPNLPVEQCNDITKHSVDRGDLCARFDPELLSTTANREGRAEIRATKQNFRYSFSLDVPKSQNYELVILGKVKVLNSVFRAQLWDDTKLTWEDWIEHGETFATFDGTSPILHPNGGPYRIDFFAYPGTPLNAEFACPFRILEVPVHTLRPGIRYGSFSG